MWEVNVSQEQKVNDIRFDGTNKTKVTYLEKLLTITSGQVFDQAQLEEDVLRIIREPAVSHAYYSTTMKASGTVDITLHIEENKTLIPAVNVWPTLDQNLAFHLGLNDYNFLGQGYTLGGFIEKIFTLDMG